MGVDLRRLAVRVPEELLDRAQRLAGGREARGKRVPQVVELDRPHAGVLAGRLEALGDLRAIERRSRLWVSENEISSFRYTVRLDQRSSSRARRSAIGTERRVERSDLPSL